MLRCDALLDGVVDRRLPLHGIGFHGHGLHALAPIEPGHVRDESLDHEDSLRRQVARNVVETSDLLLLGQECE